jgi:hypothetical protein
MRKIGAMVPVLNPTDQLDRQIDIELSHGQNHPEQHSKLRQRKQRCFFPQPNLLMPEEETG